jgi:hypothetical protein
MYLEQWGFQLAAHITYERTWAYRIVEVGGGVVLAAGAAIVSEGFATALAYETGVGIVLGLTELIISDSGWNETSRFSWATTERLTRKLPVFGSMETREIQEPCPN